MQGLGAAEDSRKAFRGGADDIVVRFLGGERASGGLGMEAHQHRLGIRCPEAFFHDPRPNAPAGAHLGYFFEEIDMRVPEKGESSREFVYLESSFDSFLDIGDAVINRKGKFLHGGRARFPDMVAAYADRVPARAPLWPRTQRCPSQASGSVWAEA